jgi:hypothetical protein
MWKVVNVRVIMYNMISESEQENSVTDSGIIGMVLLRMLITMYQMHLEI